VARQAEITLEVLNPRGVLPALPVTGLSNPRISDLNGKRIALLSEKQDAIDFFDAVEGLLKQRYPAATVLRFDSPTNPMQPDNTAQVAEACDVWLQGVKTSGSSIMDYDVKLERLGKPGASVSVEGLVTQRRRLAGVHGMPTLRIVSIPTLAYMGAEGYPEKMKAVAESMFDSIVHTLTSPLTDEEKNPRLLAHDYGPLTFTGASHDEVFERFQQYVVDNYLGDGLPVTPPTRKAVARMLTGTSRSPEEEIGRLAPRNGLATVEKIAINAVMAGAKPEYLPVIIAAIECVADPAFNLYHLSTSTGSPTPIIWINGPIAEEIGMNAGMGFLGRGNRANNTIGRAIGLCLVNIGWRLMDADPGHVGDPEGFCSFTFPENERQNPWESFAVTCGYGPEDSTVTVNETMSYNRQGPGGGMTSLTMEQALDAIAHMIKGSGTPMTKMMFSGACRYQLALNPTLARQLADAGFTKDSLAQVLQQKTSTTWEELSPGEQHMVKAFASSPMIPFITPEDCGPGMILRAFSDPEQLAILVAGDPGGNTVLWISPVGSTTVSPDVAATVTNVPPAFMTRKIRGATLTMAGH
jgi:hypothetical protein